MTQIYRTETSREMDRDVNKYKYVIWTEKITCPK